MIDELPETNLRADQTRFSPTAGRRPTTADIRARFPHPVAGARRLSNEPNPPTLGAIRKDVSK